MNSRTVYAVRLLKRIPFTKSSQPVAVAPGAGKTVSVNIGPAPGKLLLTITPAGFEEFFEEVGAMSVEQQEIPKVIAIGKKYGLEFLPPPGA